LYKWSRGSVSESLSLTHHGVEVLLDGDGPGEGGEDGQHAQLQAAVGAVQGTLTQGLQPGQNTHAIEIGVSAQQHSHTVQPVPI